MGLARETAIFVQGGVEDDNQKLADQGVDGASAEAVPLYLRWVRQDLIGVYFMLSRLNSYARLAVGLLILIAVPLWIIAMKLH
jgi:hypothetical protein